MLLVIIFDKRTTTTKQNDVEKLVKIFGGIYTSTCIFARLNANICIESKQIANRSLWVS